MDSEATNAFASSVQSNDHGQLLDIVDQLRSHGASHYLSLPQIVVCGDQSSGKSSVLAALSGFEFSIKDNLCTRFATEVILRRDSTRKLVISLIPGSNRSDEERIRLQNFKAPSLGPEDFSKLVDAAKEAMGLGVSAKAFSDDVLRVEISGPDQPHLTLVDLPGLIHSENKDQSASDVELVSALVKSYMANTRSIILAVVSAGNDYANQIVTKLAKQVDPQGNRTLGVITKPDKLDVGSESESAFVNLAGNKNVVFRLGWHVLRNRNYEERSCSPDQRDQKEKEFFQGGLWGSLPAKTLGISALRARLSIVLKEQITAELPSLVKDVSDSIKDARNTLTRLGEERSSIAEQQRFLVRVSQRFSAILRDALNGTYGHEFFGKAMDKSGFVKRLRAVIQDLLMEFAAKILREGHQHEIVENEPKQTGESLPRLISRSKYLAHVGEVIRRSRGCELPGLFSPLVVGDLFFEQAAPWKQLLEEYTDRIIKAVKVSLELILDHTTDESTSEAILRDVINPAMEICFTTLRAKVAELLLPYQCGHAITYNHYFTDTVQQARQKHLKKHQLEKAKKFFSINGYYVRQADDFSLHDLFDTVNEAEIPNMEQFSCSEATECMEAYYKVSVERITQQEPFILAQVARKTVIDNFSVLAIERCVIDRVADIFAPDTVMKLDDSTISHIAAETEESRDERSRTTKKLEILEKGLQILTSHSRDRPEARSEDNFGSSQGVALAGRSEVNENKKISDSEDSLSSLFDISGPVQSGLAKSPSWTTDLSPFNNDGSIRENRDEAYGSHKIRAWRAKSIPPRDNTIAVHQREVA